MISPFQDYAPACLSILLDIESITTAMHQTLDNLRGTPTRGEKPGELRKSPDKLGFVHHKYNSDKVRFELVPTIVVSQSSVK